MFRPINIYGTFIGYTDDKRWLVDSGDGKPPRPYYPDGMRLDTRQPLNAQSDIPVGIRIVVYSLELDL